MIHNDNESIAGKNVVVRGDSMYLLVQETLMVDVEFGGDNVELNLPK